MKKQVLIVGCMIVALMGFAQTSETKVEDNLIFDGNELYKLEIYAQAEKEYRKALARAPKNTIAQHNLGNTLFDESYYGEAFNAYKSAMMSAQSKEEKHSALHNMGNVFMNQKEYALAKELLENENQNQDQNQDQENKDNQDQQNQDQQNQDNKDSDDQSPKDDSKDNKNQDQEGDNKDQQDQSDKEKDPQNQQQVPKAQPTKLSPQQIKNLLDAMNNEEKKVQDKVNAKKVKPVKPKSKKDW
jgi:hypothetical protein